MPAPFARSATSSPTRLAFAVLFGYVTTRKSGTTFAMITLGLGELVFAMSLMFSEFFGGEAGVSGNRVSGEAFLGITYGPQTQIYYLIAIYTFAAFCAGIAGGLFTQTTQLASPDVFSFERSADLLLVLVLGGAGYLYGGLIGAVAFKILQEFFSNLTPQYWQFWIGLVLVIVVLVGRDRIQAVFSWRKP